MPRRSSGDGSCGQMLGCIAIIIILIVVCPLMVQFLGFIMSFFEALFGV